MPSAPSLRSFAEGTAGADEGTRYTREPARLPLRKEGGWAIRVCRGKPRLYKWLNINGISCIPMNTFGRMAIVKNRMKSS